MTGRPAPHLPPAPGAAVRAGQRGGLRARVRPGGPGKRARDGDTAGPLFHSGVLRSLVIDGAEQREEIKGVCVAPKKKAPCTVLYFTLLYNNNNPLLAHSPRFSFPPANHIYCAASVLSSCGPVAADTGTTTTLATGSCFFNSSSPPSSFLLAGARLKSSRSSSPKGASTQK